MNISLLRAALILAVLGGCGAAVWAVLTPLVRVESTRAGPAVSVRATERRAVNDSLVELAIQRPMFRPGRRPARTSFDPAKPAELESAAAPTVPKPTLRLSGILWSSRPAALVEGVPGTESSTVLESGQSVAGIRVTKIDRERVVLRGLDTTWTLQVRDPWK